jgi:hypothetical protein
VITGLAVVGLASWTLANWGMEETDNAQLQAEITQISSRVAGTIERVAAERDQAVAAGTPLVQHPDRPRQLPWPSRQVPGLARQAGAGPGLPAGGAGAGPVNRHPKRWLGFRCRLTPAADQPEQTCCHHWAAKQVSSP